MLPIHRPHVAARRRVPHNVIHGYFVPGLPADCLKRPAKAVKSEAWYGDTLSRHEPFEASRDRVMLGRHWAAICNELFNGADECVTLASDEN
jgi:hypothetical protein